MSEFKEYKPMEIEHNVKAAVENLRKAYWSNETKKVAKHYTEAEDIIISAICHQHYTVCKETTEGDLISRSDLKEEISKMPNANPSYWNKCDVVDRENVLDEIDNALTVDITEEQAIDKLHKTGWLPMHDKEMTERPQGDLISREALKGVIETYRPALIYNNKTDMKNKMVDYFLDEIDNAPTVEEDKIIQCHSIESKAYVDGFKKGYKKGERTSLDLAKEVIAKFEGYLDEDMIERIQIALEKESGADMKEVQTSEHAIAQLPMGTMFEGFDLNIEDFMISVYWGSCHELVKADIDFPRIEEMLPYGDFRHITSEQILKEKPDNVSMVTVIYNDWTTGAILQYGNYTEGDWVMLGRLYGFA